ncbi:Fc.00g114140.m01.CDS01 [Cosmosporella sp. VM-42]
METPTTIELYPGREIQVTIFDANHCVGAVMFLIEGDGNAILYTGDIRSEPWFVNSLARSPSLVEYTAGIRTLDKIYIDTSFIEDIPFQTKAEGIAELLRKVSQYPADTVFHVQAWTYGYEDVWVALSKALKSPIHVDDYKLRIYGSLKTRASETGFGADFHMTPESPALTGCEKGNMCDVSRRSSTVVIQPVIAHLPSGEDLAEHGVGGGGDDLEREVELDFLNQIDLDSMIDIICSSGNLIESDADVIKKCLLQTITTGRKISLDIDITSLDKRDPTQDVVGVLAEKLRNMPKKNVGKIDVHHEHLPKTIRFPYSRHSSYPELCDLVRVFRPKDVWPCTVNPAEWLSQGVTIQSLFGHLCSSDVFKHDKKMEAVAKLRVETGITGQPDTQASVGSAPRLDPSPSIPPLPFSPLKAKDTRQSFQERPPNLPSVGESTIPERLVSQLANTQPTTQEAAAEEELIEAESLIEIPSSEDDGSRDIPPPSVQKRRFDEYSREGSEGVEPCGSQQTEKSFTSTLSARHSLARREAYFQMLDNATADTWAPISLISTSSEHTTVEQEL